MFSDLFRRGWFGTGVAILVIAAGLNAQTPTPLLDSVERPFDFTAGRTFGGSLPRPETVLGYETGKAYADYGDFRRLLDLYAAKTDRMKVFVTGETNERRPMYLLAISSPANLKRLDEIKAANLRLTDGRSNMSDRELDKAVAKQPIIVWLGYNIHGDEAAGTEAAMQVLYTLLDGTDAALKTWLDNAVILMNPCQNPDGRERFVTWANAHGIGRAETFAFEKENPWVVQGRYNHYYFDLNRDMLTTSQVESRNSGAAYLSWMPQVSVDHHGETKEFFFPPAALPINRNLPREATDHWLDVFGRGNAAAFDRQGWMYYVRDYFDVFYAGYWDSWPSLQGATGMTYETSGGGKQGFNLRRDDGSIMTLRAAVAKHFTASFATVATAVANRETRLRDFRAHFVSAVQAGREGEMQQVWLAPGQDGHRTAELVRALLRSGVEVHQTTEPATITAAHRYLGGVEDLVAMPAGSFVVDMAQPRGRVARAFLEVDTPMDEAFTTRQQEKAARNRDRGDNAPTDDYEFYDITAWTLPLAFGVDAYWTGAPVAVTGAVLTTVIELTVKAPVVAKSAYLIRPGSEGAQRLALDLLEAGYRVATSVRPLEAGGAAYPRGTLIVRVERNPASLHAKLVELGSRYGVEIAAVDSAFTNEGITGIGSESIFSLRAPKVLVVAGSPVVPGSYGALKFLFEQTYGVDYVPVSIETLGGIDLREFNVIVLPSGSPGGYGRKLGEGGKTKLKTWVEQGGTLICLGGATEMAIDASTGWTSVKSVGADADSDLPALPTKAATTDDDDSAGEASVEDQAATDNKPLPVPGALIRAVVDHEHFLTFGYAQDEIPFLVNTDTFFTASDTGTNVVTFAEENLWLSGYVWPQNTERLIAGTAAVVDEPVGDGHIILFTDEPGYRAIWHTTTRMLMNAILYAPGLRNETGSYSR